MVRQRLNRGGGQEGSDSLLKVSLSITVNVAPSPPPEGGLNDEEKPVSNLGGQVFHYCHTQGLAGREHEQLHALRSDTPHCNSFRMKHPAIQRTYHSGL